MSEDVTGQRLRLALARELRTNGVLRGSGWKEAVETVPREVFVGEAVYRLDQEGLWQVVRRSDLSEADWLTMVYQDDTWVTQVEGVNASDPHPPSVGAPTSSSSLPSLVVGMLEDLDVRDGQRVLEVATGTGYSTALLCHRLGQERVTSVEVDAGVAARAEKALGRVGYRPRLLVQDGYGGGWALGERWGDGEDVVYDRIIATCAFRFVPLPWLGQVGPGAKVLVTLAGWLGANAQVLLEAEEDGTMRGRFLPVQRSFMMARSMRAPAEAPLVLGPNVPRRPTDVGAEVLDDWTGRFVVQLTVPEAVPMVVGPSRGVRDIGTGSWALVDEDADGTGVSQHGPVNLWERVENSVRWWRALGEPSVSEFGLTVSPREQRVWLGSPGGPSWKLPV
ncbi:ATP-grasp peptide maturase system methyltransferase [Nocardiopsis sp. CNS-639]|uniref:ATP-grasp peptide maturase system methyltransferase n=1 Tax=Nocardiopsis sp. CNS-639 TaxID=1169153 RepID=UPI000361185D|nr:ATP-grasp peptide maturase system methyltransferase [Nocardiopsis sp. CNS-639]